MKVASKCFEARMDALNDVLAFIEEMATDPLSKGRRLTDLLVAVEEAFTNVAKHAYDEGGEVDIEVRSSRTEVAVTLRDRGIPFDPREAAPPNLDAPPEDRPVGSLGVHLIYGLADEVRYRREGEMNVLTLVVRPSKGSLTKNEKE